MTDRTYQQRCPIARALDVVGERWALLIVRELILGPARYGQLLEALPAMGTRVLAERLKELAARDVIVSTESGYALTERGAALGPVLSALAQWGEPLLARDAPRDASPASTVVLLLVGRLLQRSPRDGTVLQMFVEDRPFVLTAAEGRWTAARGEAEAPDGTLSVRIGAAIDLLEGRSSVREELDKGALALEGLSQRRVRELFGFRLDAGA